jgi:hypothetical protein
MNMAKKLTNHLKNYIRIAVVALFTASIMLCVVFGFTGCSNGKRFKVDGWTLFQYNGHMKAWSELKGQVNIISADDESLVVDGVLNIPSKIGKYTITGFGQPQYMVTGPSWDFTINENLEVNHIVLAEELQVNELFFGGGINSVGRRVKYIEFLSDTFENIAEFYKSTRIFIIPDGSTQNFIDRFSNHPYMTFMEKSEWLATQS